jgi:hypothetical protein
MRATRRPNRSGTVLPMLGVCLIGLFAFVALAIDLGVLAVSRTQSQNAADVAALVGTRTLNNKDGVSFNNLPAAVASARASATGNPHLSANFSNAQITRIEVGQYLYDSTSQTFRVNSWTDVTSGGGVAAPSGSWTAMRVTLGVDQPTYFMRLLGVNSMASGARATAVYRPRDIAFTLDMTGSMAFSSTFNFNNQSQNPDPLVPRAGHYVSIQSALVSTANQANGSGEAIQRNNFTISTPGGPPIVRNFYFDPTNMANPLVPAFPLTTVGSNPNLRNAFHRWSPPESGGNSDTYTAVIYDFSQYDPTHTGLEANPRGPIPAPDFYGSMTDSGSVVYHGDRWRRGNGAIDKTETTWGTGSAATRAAFHAADLLGYGTNPPTGITPAFTTDWLNFRDPVWERWGYDLDIVKYRAQRAGGAPMAPDTFRANNGNSDANILLPVADRFKGFSMGPGYWGKTWYIWPPDPRAPVGNPGDANYQPGDWRRRYFLTRNGGTGAALNPQGDNNTTNTAGTTDGINEVLFSTGSGQTLSSAVSVPGQVNYPAILRWIKSGPQVMPPNLRAGRVLFYSSIPNDVDTTTGGTQERLDKALWKAYIDFVLGIGSYTGAGNMYGSADSWASSTQSITTSDLTTYKFGWQPLADAPTRPYMRYTDSPRRPRLQFWFGPLSFMDFISAVNGNWMPGTCYEAQCWQLKAGVSAVLDDVKNNHPNDFAGMVFFALSHHNGVRVGMNQNFARLKNALFYPRSLLNAIDSGNITNEYRPYNTSLGGYNAAEIPNSSGSTDPATGLSYAYNLLSSSQLSAATAVGTGGGRRGAQKIVIFETDGVPNSYRVPTFNARGFNSYYTLGGTVSDSNGSTTNMNHTYTVIQQIVKQMATTGTTSTGPDSGHSLPNAPARVFPIAFGDLFDEQLAPSATFRPTALQFLATCAQHGGTGPAGATTLPADQIITGPYQQRITRLRDTLERIFQGGVSVVLVE